MNSAAKKARLAREVKNLNEKPPWGITCWKCDTFDALDITMMGPKSSPYEGGAFKIKVTIPDNYPFEPPILKFCTPIYHPNIDTAGRICMDMLKMPSKGTWLPTITLETLLVSLQALLAAPNPEDPLRIDVAKEYLTDLDGFLLKARRSTEQYAK